MLAYKLFRLKNGKLYPLFINRNQEIEIGKEMEAEYHPTKGFAARKGWHCTLKPVAPHLKLELKSGEKRVWAECEVDGVVYYNRPESQGGKWVLAQTLKVRKLL